jgi:hypothetical protein
LARFRLGSWPCDMSFSFTELFSHVSHILCYTYIKTIQGENVCSNFWKFIVKQSGKCIHLHFHALDYNCSSFDSKCALALPVICHQGHCSQENGDTSAKAKCVTWFIITNVK